MTTDTTRWSLLVRYLVQHAPVYGRLTCIYKYIMKISYIYLYDKHDQFFVPLFFPVFSTGMFPLCVTHQRRTAHFSDNYLGLGRVKSSPSFFQPAHQGHFICLPSFFRWCIFAMHGCPLISYVVQSVTWECYIRIGHGWVHFFALSHLTQQVYHGTQYIRPTFRVPFFSFRNS